MKKEIKSTNNLALGLAVAAVGLLLLYLVHGKPELTRNEFAAQLAGYLLLFLGLATIIWNEEIEVQIEPNQRIIRYRKKNIMGSQQMLIPFSAVHEVVVNRIGKPSNYTETYLISFRLKDGRKLRTGKFYMSDVEAYQEAQSLAEQFGCEKNQKRSAVLDNSPDARAVNLMIAFAGAVVLYAVYYRSAVGQWCPAMWFGTLPPVFILVSMSSIYALLKRFRVTS